MGHFACQTCKTLTFFFGEAKSLLFPHLLKVDCVHTICTTADSNKFLLHLDDIGVLKELRSVPIVAHNSDGNQAVSDLWNMQSPV